ncbi:MAG TPA: hypothetical protein DDW52_30090 [Planctomycetaceae bacterium]|nr:hypothetical protein [Planctomycetaceae bacterium]
MISPLLIPIVGALALFTWLIISTIVHGVKAIVKHRNEVELKQMLVDRGMNAEEIARVVEATSVLDEEDE